MTGPYSQPIPQFASTSAPSSRYTEMPPHELPLVPDVRKCRVQKPKKNVNEFQQYRNLKYKYLGIVYAKRNPFDQGSAFDFLQVVLIWHFFVVDELIFVLCGFSFPFNYVEGKRQAFVDFLLQNIMDKISMIVYTDALTCLCFNAVDNFLASSNRSHAAW